MEKTREPAIQVKNLYKIFRVGNEKVRALNGVDLTIYKGEFCAIVGTSGSGKSTMLNMLAGLEKPTKGEVIVAGEHLEKMNENQLVMFSAFGALGQYRSGRKILRLLLLGLLPNRHRPPPFWTSF